MAHDLSIRNDGTVEYAWAGKEPWHGLGTKCENAMTAEEAIRAANLGWSVSKRQLITTDGVDCPELFAIVRDDTNAPLGGVGPQYKPTQIWDAAAFIDAVVGCAKAKYVSVGALGGGKRIFFVAELPGIIRVKGDDIVKPYLTFVHGHDGTMAHRLWSTATRVVCANTLKLAVAEKGGFYARHTGNLEYRIEEAAEILGFATRRFELFEEQSKALAAVVVSVQQVESFLRSVFEIEKGKEEEVSEQKQAAVNTVLDNFENGEKNNLPGIKGTAWSLLNATTEYYDHQAPAILTDDAEKRMNNTMFGQGDNRKTFALNAVLELI